MNLFEHIKLSKYKDWHNIKNENFDKKVEKFFKLFPNHDKNYYRIYLDFKVHENDWKYKIPTEIEEYLEFYGYPIIDVRRGLCFSLKDQRKIRIGKILSDMKRDDLLKIYAESKNNILKNFNELLIVISRHTYDIAGQSTNRRWTTCHDLDDKGWNGKYLYQMRQDMIRGSIVSYVIEKNDKNINNPLSRILILKDSYQNIYPTDEYGIFIPGFKEEILKFCNDFNYKNNDI